MTQTLLAEQECSTNGGYVKSKCLFDNNHGETGHRERLPRDTPIFFLILKS